MEFPPEQSGRPRNAFRQNVHDPSGNVATFEKANEYAEPPRLEVFGINEVSTALQQNHLAKL